MPAGEGKRLRLVGREDIDQRQEFAHAGRFQGEIAMRAVGENADVPCPRGAQEIEPGPAEAEGLQQPLRPEPVEQRHGRRQHLGLAIADEAAFARVGEGGGNALHVIREEIEGSRIEMIVRRLLQHQPAEQIGAEIDCPARVDPEPGQRQGHVIGAARPHRQAAGEEFGARPRHIAEAGENQVAEIFADDQNLAAARPLTAHCHSPT